MFKRFPIGRKELKVLVHWSPPMLPASATADLAGSVCQLVYQLVHQRRNIAEIQMSVQKYECQVKLTLSMQTVSAHFYKVNGALDR